MLYNLIITNYYDFLKRTSRFIDLKFQLITSVIDYLYAISIPTV